MIIETLLGLARNAFRDLSRVRRVVSWTWNHPLAAAAIVTGIAAFVGFIGWIVSIGGTGFNTQTEDMLNPRTLWDWLGLLLIQAVLGVSGVLFNLILSHRAESERNTDREIADGRNREQTLRRYLDTMQQLIIGENLDYGSDARLRQVARAQTIAAINALDTKRFDQVINFLRDAELLDFTDYESETAETGPEKPPITFKDADLRGVIWPGVNLQRLNLNAARLTGANLSSAYMEQINLHDASLQDTNLEKAFLSDADFTGAQLARACFREANLEDASLSGATLADADFKAADLTGVNFENAIDVTAKQLNAATSLRAVTLPDGTQVPDEELSKHERYVVHLTSTGWSVEKRRRFLFF